MPRGPLGFPRLTNIGPLTEDVVDSNIRLIQGDSSKSLRDMSIEGSPEIDAVITDPPYGINVESFGVVEGALEGDANPEEAVSVFADAMDEADPMLREGAPVMVFAGDDTLCDFFKGYIQQKYRVYQTLVWDKISKGPPFQNPWWGYSYEMIIHASNGSAQYVNTNKTDRDVLQFRRIGTNQNVSKRHPTEKPVDLMEYIVESVTERGDVVLDPFMGSGTTGVACKNLGRDFVGIEIDEVFFSEAKARLQ